MAESQGQVHRVKFRVKFTVKFTVNIRVKYRVKFRVMFRVSVGLRVRIDQGSIALAMAMMIPNTHVSVIVVRIMVRI